jgi:hypothetical protein
MHELGTQILDAYLRFQILVVQIGDTHPKDMQENYVIEIICICILYHPSNYTSVDISLLHYVMMQWCIKLCANITYICTDAEYICVFMLIHICVLLWISFHEMD